MTPRIIGGRLRGLKLEVPAGRDTRPTADRLREQLFNILTHRRDDGVGGAHVGDIFAGTGALGLEALSRGAASAVFVEKAPAALAALRANLSAAEQRGPVSAEILAIDSARLPMRAQPLDILFLDPPYGAGLIAPTLDQLRHQGWLASQSLVIIECDAREDMALPAGFEEQDVRRSGRSQLRFARLT